MPTLAAFSSATASLTPRSLMKKSANSLSLRFPAITNFLTNSTRSSSTSARIIAANRILSAPAVLYNNSCLLLSIPWLPVIFRTAASHKLRPYSPLTARHSPLPRYEFNHIQPAPPASPHRSRTYPATRSGLHARVSRYSFRSTQLARKPDPLCRFLLHHRRVHRFPSHHFPHYFSP